MKVYTINGSQITTGALLSAGTARKPAAQRVLTLGGCSTSKDVPMFKKNPPEIDDTLYAGTIKEAHPVKIAEGWALAKPNRESDRILVVISTRTHHSTRREGSWSFDSKTSPTDLMIDQTLVRATGPKDYMGDQQSEANIGWRDALIIMKVGDVITVRTQGGDVAIWKYESVEKGLVVDTRVRMILQDYDAAPDGVGTYTKLDAEFPSRKAAINYRDRCLHGMYWGKIVMAADGELVQHLEERHDW